MSMNVILSLPQFKIITEEVVEQSRLKKLIFNYWDSMDSCDAQPTLKLFNLPKSSMGEIWDLQYEWLGGLDGIKKQFDSILNKKFKQSDSLVTFEFMLYGYNVWTVNPTKPAHKITAKIYFDNVSGRLLRSEYNSVLPQICKNYINKNILKGFKGYSSNFYWDVSHLIEKKLP